ncbi:ergic53 [Carabus blaptoides fortunei]
MRRFYLNINVVFAFTAACLCSFISANTPHKRFEYKYSFKPPYLAQKDGSVPFWEYGGNTIASSENVRIVPSLRSQKGAIWTRQPTNFEWWEVDIVFRVTGRGRVGADGLAFWFTETKGAYDGDVFGSSDQWVGLGVFFDSFDNDNKHNNPYIMAVQNDGTRHFDHQNDGTTQQLAGCLRDFRNKPFPTRARIEYYMNTLTLLFHNGMTNNDQDYEVCFRLENVKLPKFGYFGLSAATGGLADDHDVFHFLTTSLHSATSGTVVAEDEQLKLREEYQEYQRKLDQHKEDYRKEHPDQVKDPGFEDWFETDNQRELRQIFQGQSSMFEVLRELNRKLDEVVGRQERTLSLLSAVQSGGAVPQLPPGHAPPQMAVATGEGIRRTEVEALLNNQNIILSTTIELKNFLGDVKTKTDTILSNQARQPTAQVQAVGYDMQSLVSEMRDGMNHLKLSMAQKGGAPVQDCPNVSCVSLTTLLVVIAGQLVLMLGYSLYRDNKEQQAKKFY